jgi:hypothetical protein
MFMLNKGKGKWAWFRSRCLKYFIKFVFFIALVLFLIPFFYKPEPIPVFWTEYRNDMLDYVMEFPSDLAMSRFEDKDKLADYMSFHLTTEAKSPPSISFHALSPAVYDYQFANASDFINTYEETLTLASAKKGQEIILECSVYIRDEDYISASGVIFQRYHVHPTSDDCPSKSNVKLWLQVKKDDKTFFFNLAPLPESDSDTISKEFYPIVDRFRFI